MMLPDSAALVDNNGSGLAYAPDGSAFAYSSRLGLMLRAADQLEAVPVAGARRAVSPFFSPDGLWLGFTWMAPDSSRCRSPAARRYDL